MRRSLLPVLGLSLALLIPLLPAPSGAQAPEKSRPTTPKADPRTAPYRDDVPRGMGLDLDALVDETQKGSTDPDRMTVVWWVPEEFWRTALQDNQEVTKAEAEQFIEVMRPYTLMIVVDGIIGDDLNVRYSSEAQIRSQLRMKGMDGTTYAPLTADKIGAGPQVVVEVIKPMFANLLGPMGENMRFFYFPATGKNGARLAAARAEGQLSMFIGPREYRWRLPLGSVFASRKCPTCGEVLSGAYKFCPYDGIKLPLGALPGGT